MSSSNRSSDRRSSASADDRTFNDDTTQHNPERHLRVRTTGGRRTLVLESSNTYNKNTVAIPIHSLRDNGERTSGDITTYSFTLNGAPLTIATTDYTYNVLTYTPTGHGHPTISHVFEADVGMNDDGRALHDAIATLRAHVTGPSASARSSDPRSHHSSSGSRRGAGAGAGTRRQQGGRRRRRQTRHK
jgi:hypothetical protein